MVPSMETLATTTLVLTAQCPDHPGLVAALTATVHHLGGNILESDHFTDPHANQFFLRVRCDFRDYPHAAEDLRAALRPMAQRARMDIKVTNPAIRPRVAILVSKQDHCLADLLQRHQRHELPMDIALILSNHLTCAPWAARFGNIPFHACPINADTKRSQERLLLGFLKDARVELVILARYMQILSNDFLIQAGCPIINIHHSFLPAFIGAKPYEQAHARGVKLIGTTAHYATADLDQGPIIAQAATPVTHRHQVEDLVRIGRDLEQQVLARAVRLHLERRVLIHQNKTVVFE